MPAGPDDIGPAWVQSGTTVPDPSRSTIMQSTERTRPARRLLTVLATGGVAAALALAPVSSPAASATTTANSCKPTTATGWQAAVTKAQTALTGAVTSLQHHEYATAITRLRAAKQQVRIATTGAISQIGKPPTDPESDDPPGPTAVLKVARLEHQVTLKLVPLFNNLQGIAVTPLGSTLTVSDACRDVMLGKVLALSPAKIDDYTDGLSDTLPDYKKELTAFSTALSTGDLTDAGRSSLQRAQQIVNATSAAMNKAFGGGERPAL
jgi:hypothetical protein